MRNVPGVNNNIAGAQSRVRTGCGMCVINQLNIRNDGYQEQFSNILYKVHHNHDLDRFIEGHGVRWPGYRYYMSYANKEE